jgi:FkbM family methyltransferase
MTHNNKSNQINKLSIHHIGARDGSGTFPKCSKFRDDLIQFFYDADADCIEQIDKQLIDNKVTLPYCIGENQSMRTFHINMDPYTSSLLKLNPAYQNYYYFSIDPYKGPLDYCYGDTVKTMEKRTVSMTSLDQLFKAQPDIIPPDFLSLDTQGSEYEILKGAINTLHETIIAIQLEVEFHEIYKNQKLFGDICHLLNRHGFIFVKFTELHELSPFRSPIGLRADGFQVYGEALFFRQTDTFQLNKENIIPLYKLAFFSLLFNQFEYCIQCLNIVKENTSENLTIDISDNSYIPFLDNLWNLIVQQPIVYPPLFSQKYSFESSQSRFKPQNELKVLDDYFIEIVDEIRCYLKSIDANRLCMLPYGKYAKQYSDRTEDNKGVDITYHDNSFQQFTNENTTIQSLQNITADDYVIITTFAYENELMDQIKNQVPRSQILLMSELGNGHVKPKQWFQQDTKFTTVESFLYDNGFSKLAKQIKKTRLQQNYDY